MVAETGRSGGVPAARDGTDPGKTPRCRRRRVWLASYPRSGNTLLRCVLFRCFGLPSTSVYEQDLGNRALERAVGHFEPSILPPTLADDTPLLVKTHGPPVDDGPAIYVVRDGRPATVSLWKFYGAHRRSPRSLRDVVAGDCTHGGWSAHLEAWRPWERPDTLLLRYEELTCDLPAVLAKLVGFLERPALGRRVPSRLLMAVMGGRRVHLRSRWRHEFAPHEALFRARHGAMMRRMGYDLDDTGRLRPWWRPAGLGALSGD